MAASAAADYLMMMGYATGSWAMARIVLATEKSDDAEFTRLQAAVASFYFDKIAPHANAHYLAIENSSAEYYELDQSVL